MAIFALVLTHFNQIMGPEIIYSFPESIPDEISEKMCRYFDINIDDTFFEINLVKENLVLVNLYFEIPSEKARGGFEMTMISVITDKEHKSKEFYNILKDCSKKIIETEDIYRCFHKECEDGERKRDILKYHLIDCLNRLKSEITPNVDYTKLLDRFKKLSW